MNKFLGILIVISLILTLTNLILTNQYIYILIKLLKILYRFTAFLEEIALKSNQRNLRYLEKMRNVLGPSILKLQIVLLCVEAFQTLFFIILNTKQIRQLIGLNFDKIALQKNHDFSNFILELVFMILLKVGGILACFYLINESNKEIIYERFDLNFQ